jgi:hypothetical protein
MGAGKTGVMAWWYNMQYQRSQNLKPDEDKTCRLPYGTQLESTLDEKTFLCYIL